MSTNQTLFSLVNFSILLSVRARTKELAGSCEVVILALDVRQAARREIRLVLPMREACGNWSHGKTLAETDSNKIEDHVSVRFG